MGELYVYGIAVDPAGSALVTGTAGRDFVTTPGAFQTASGGGNESFIVKLNSAGSELLYSTYLGGSGDDLAEHNTDSGECLRDRLYDFAQLSISKPSAE
jgi:hypothetical protein